MIFIFKTNQKGVSNYFSNKNEVLGKKLKFFKRGQILRQRHIKKIGQ